MTRHAIIVDPYSAATDYAPAFRARGVSRPDAGAEVVRILDPVQHENKVRWSAGASEQ